MKNNTAVHPEEIVKEFTYSGVTLKFSKKPDAPIYFAQTPVGYYEIECLGSTYSFLTPWDEEPHCGLDDLEEAMKACVQFHILITHDY